LQTFNFIRPENLDQACGILSENRGKVKILAGGTDVMIELRDNKLPLAIETIMEISHLEELSFIEDDGENIRIGAAATHAEVAESDLIRKNAPLLAEAATSVGSPQIRNRGTVAGNSVTASPAADTIPPLLVLDATVVLRRGTEKREVPLREIFAGPNQVTIGNDELVTGIYFEKVPAAARTAFIKLARRNSAAKSRMNFAALARQNNAGEVVELRISAGSVTPSPTRFTAAEIFLLGKIPDPRLLQEAGEAVSGEMIRQSGYRWSTDYKKPVVESLTVRILEEVLTLH